jgi:hypothetical protein
MDISFWGEEVLDHLAAGMVLGWGPTRAALTPFWAASPYPTLIPKDITGPVNVQWGPQYEFLVDPQIEIAQYGFGSKVQYLGNQWRIFWDIGVTVFFRVPLLPHEINRLCSRYSVLAFRTIRRYFNWNSDGKIIEISLLDNKWQQRPNEGNLEVVEAAAALRLEVWAQHHNR